MLRKLMISCSLVFHFSITVAQWDSVGAGVYPYPDGYGGVFALMPYNGNLYVGGGYIKAGDSADQGIASWNGTNWSNLPSNKFHGIVNALAIY
ncbi:MAG TPA: hypothetical protein VNY36_06200, partial [Bacteroidia bacterium]|nr:hypothetical protein [Bacteroidia bacterium]